ncbi:metal-dependent hydrolase [Halegenticoccus tardaugens]|uniref:metal-dependent hydrolase n=1 Tax=Halegenticoccus tardaugens TaxID=2071624 RepID=UPI00100B44DE|nr:metal-dependent hydrolase [Halegenticoccus tardaugens]
MMVTTHAAIGLLLALPLVAVAPELAAVGALAAVAGGVFPDLDLLVGVHRRTLHFPAYYWLPALSASALALARPGPATVAVALFFLSAAVHSVSDAFGGGPELRPWEATSDEGVYLHPKDRWIPPKRWIRYDGAPEDLLLAAALSIPALFAFDGVVRSIVVVGLVISAAYAAVRKRIPEELLERFQ